MPTPEKAVDRTVMRVWPITRFPSGDAIVTSRGESPDARVRAFSEMRVVSSLSVTSS
jgi:hypothetical protein